MNVLVDTCIWSRILRHRRPDPKLTVIVEELIREGRVVIIGPIRQEILSGIPNPKQFENLRSKLAAFEDLPLDRRYFETAAYFCNICRAKGVQGSLVDFLICAVSHHEHLHILTIDEDFKRYRKYLDIHLVSFSPS